MAVKHNRKPKFHVKTGDIVEAVAGDESGTGKSGKVLKVLPQKGMAIVEGLNFIKKHMRKTQDNPDGGIIEKEGPIAVSNLRVIESSKGKPGQQ